MALTKTYVVVNVRRESKDMLVIELLDESSIAPNVKTALFRMGLDDYKALEYPNPAETKVTIAITVVEQAKTEIPT